MKVLWLCNITLPDIANKLNLKASNKEGWLSGILNTVKQNHDFELGVAFPVPKEIGSLSMDVDGVKYYGFLEDTNHPEKYDKSLEETFKDMVSEFSPDVIHCFGTEYPHTLAMCKVMKDEPKKLLIGIQGILEIYKDHYFDGLPNEVISSVTFRDFIKRDTLKTQQKKYALRAFNEVEAVKLAGNITGRTPFDLDFATVTNPDAKYHFMNETLRNCFYEDDWNIDEIERHSIFLSQGNYPIKGLHVMLEALNSLKEKYPDIKVYIAGDVINRFATIKDKIKIGAYGKYILKLINQYNLKEYLVFTGSLDATLIKERLLKSHIFVCPSSIENSPNSLGEAMVLGVPSIASNVGGISGIFKANVDGLIFENMDARGLADCIERIFEDDSLAKSFSENAKLHASITHNPRVNYKRLLEIYSDIVN